MRTLARTGIVGVALVVLAFAWTSGGTPALPELEFAGGWRPLSLKGCGLSLGVFVGGLLGMPANPLLGATVASVAFHAALAFCT